jgi:hypothetical protein
MQEPLWPRDLDLLAEIGILLCMVANFIIDIDDKSPSRMITFLCGLFFLGFVLALVRHIWPAIYRERNVVYFLWIELKKWALRAIARLLGRLIKVLIRTLDRVMQEREELEITNA